MKKNTKESIIITSCPICGHSHVIEVSEADYWEWRNGATVQDAFPYLSAAEREILVSGICPTCWEKTFEDLEEDEDDEDDFEDWEAIAEEYGYNPYMGCYDFDC